MGEADKREVSKGQQKRTCVKVYYFRDIDRTHEYRKTTEKIYIAGT